MKNAISSFSTALSLIRKDRFNLILAIIPVIIGIIAYYFLGSWAYKTMFSKGKILIESYISEGNLGSFIYITTMTLLTILLYFLISWTFVLFVSLIASPFNDLLSSRIEKQIKGQEQLTANESMNLFIKNLFKTLFTEVKKISFIISLTAVAFVFSYIPFLTPISLFVSMVLLSIEFVDYSWSRHKLSFRECFRDLRSNLFGYGLGGSFFFVIISIPIFNLIVPSYATSYFTVLWLKNNEG